MNAEELIEAYLGSKSSIEVLLRNAAKEYRGSVAPSFSGKGYDLEFANPGNAKDAWEYLYFHLEGSKYKVAQSGPSRMPGGMYWFGVYKR